MVASILENPRYTGRQVWNGQHTDHDPGSSSGRSWNDHSDWIVSERAVPPPLVCEAEFVAVQAMRAERTTMDGNHRRYRLSGLLSCGSSGRRMDSHCVNKPGYRCRHGHTSAKSRTPGQPRSVCVREDRLPEALAARLGLREHDEIGPLLTERQLMIVYGREGVHIQGHRGTKPGP